MRFAGYVSFPIKLQIKVDKLNQVDLIGLQTEFEAFLLRLVFLAWNSHTTVCVVYPNLRLAG